MIHFRCERCGERLEAPDSLRGKTLECSTCQHNPLVSGRNPAMAAKRFRAARGQLGSLLIRAWLNTPAAFRTGFLGTLGGLAAIFTGLFIYGHSLTTSQSDINIATPVASSNSLDAAAGALAEIGAFPRGSTAGTPGILRGRTLRQHMFTPDANLNFPGLTLWTDGMGQVEGVSAYWTGDSEGLPARIGENNLEWERNSAAYMGFEVIVGRGPYVTPASLLPHADGDRLVQEMVCGDWTIYRCGEIHYRPRATIHCRRDREPLPWLRDGQPHSCLRCQRKEVVNVRTARTVGGELVRDDWGAYNRVFGMRLCGLGSLEPAL